MGRRPKTTHDFSRSENIYCFSALQVVVDCFSVTLVTAFYISKHYFVSIPLYKGDEG
jgi:hypothetical protein